jgi:hypothetical protein
MDHNVKANVLAELPKLPRFSPTAHWAAKIPGRAAARRPLSSQWEEGRRLELRFEGCVDKVNLTGQDWREC